MDKVEELLHQVQDLTQRVNEMDRRVHQTDIPTGTIKGYHIEQQQDWIPVIFEGTWANEASVFNPATYMKDSLGFVHVRGLIKDGTINTTAFTLPVGYRPQYKELIPAYTSTGAGRVDISPDGAVAPNSGGTGYFGLDAILFKAYS